MIFCKEIFFLSEVLTGLTTSNPLDVIKVRSKLHSY